VEFRLGFPFLKNEVKTESDTVQVAKTTASAEPRTTTQEDDDKPVRYVRPHGFDKDDLDGWVNMSSNDSFAISPEIRTEDGAVCMVELYLNQVKNTTSALKLRTIIF